MEDDRKVIIYIYVVSGKSFVSFFYDLSNHNEIPRISKFLPLFHEILFVQKILIQKCFFFIC